jgi:hypothetical protein
MFQAEFSSTGGEVKVNNSRIKCSDQFDYRIFSKGIDKFTKITSIESPIGEWANFVLNNIERKFQDKASIVRDHSKHYFCV